MSGFNTSTRKETFSIKLKSQNIKNAQTETKKLELESRKMEERLRELKVAMGKEKEQREKQGGHWKKGKSGSLNTYANEVLEKQKLTREPKKRSVKLLKDEKIVLPNRSGEPGTMKYIAESQQINNKDRSKVAKCGQCEERSASVSCVQCSELFCAGCFSAFHYKGALKRHRTIPLQNSGPRKCMSPRVSAPNSYRSPRHGAEASSVSSVVYQNNEWNSPVGASGSGVRSTLLSGQYSEDESAASFQNALQAWRSEDSVVTSPERNGVISTSPKRPVSRVRTPTVKMEISTSTQEIKEPIEIKFTNHGVSYADRLLLKKHRRTDVDHINRTTSSANTDNNDTLMENGDDELEPVDFQALYQAMVPCNSTSPGNQRIVETSLSIIDIDNTPKRKYRNVEQSSFYQVEEVSDLTAWKIQNSINSSPKQPDNSASTLSRQPEITSPVYSPSTSKSTCEHLPSISPMHPVDNRTHVTRPSFSKSKEDNSNMDSATDIIDQSPNMKAVNGMSDVSYSATSKSKSAKSTRPKSSLSRPDSRAKSSISRPASRAKSRAASRLQFQGLLTKSPTPALQDVAKMVDREMTMSETVNNYRSVFDNFFSYDHDGKPDISKPATPIPDSQKKKDTKVSYTLYQMAPRSWRPESSLGNNIPSEAVLPETSDAVLACLPDSSSHVPLETRSISRNICSVLSNTEDFEEDTHELMMSRRNKNYVMTQNARINHQQFEMEFKEEFEKQLYSPRSQRENTNLMTPIRLDEISCNTETPQLSGRKSQAIVGEDYSRYDVDNNNQSQDDQDTLDKLEWELASESGRITADGKISRLSLRSNSRSGSNCSTVRNSLSSTGNDKGYDINTRLREDELVDSDEDSKLLTDRRDVLALK